ncbi:MAG: hypothetical protein WCF15_10005, partial [Pseudolabrys sp.]
AELSQSGAGICVKQSRYDLVQYFLNSPALLRFLEVLRAGLEKQLDSRGTRRKSERGYEYSVFFAGHCSSMSCRTVPRSCGDDWHGR